MIGTDLDAQTQAMASSHPEIHACLDPGRIEKQRLRGGDPRDSVDHFGEAQRGGRGESYVVAQRSTGTRARGIYQLVDIIAGNSRAKSKIIVDLLGGDGLVSRVARLSGRDDVLVVTCDGSPFMVSQAWARGIPALWQRAEALLFRDGSVGGVLLAYGSHHIPPEQRGAVAGEAFRVIQPGGVFVLHDFLTGSPADTWFRKVVDVYAATGHDFVHFEREESVSCLASAGFADVQAILIDDSFVVSGTSKEAAELALGRYLIDMYGLVRLSDELGPEGAPRRAFELASDIFRYEDKTGAVREIRSFGEHSSGWSTTMPRDALVAFGRKPLAER